MNTSARHLIRTAALVESRAHLYSGYLATVFAEQGWQQTFADWGAEEATHGGRLRAWLAANDASFDFDTLLARYLEAVPYHDAEEGSAYGSKARELLARCLVEAMAVSYYQAVGAAEPKCRQLCRALAGEEARHFTMFRRMLASVGSVGHLEAVSTLVQRLASFSDEQIIYASWLARGSPGVFRLSREAWRYRLHVVRLYRWREARTVVRLLQQVWRHRPANLNGATRGAETSHHHR